jgi:altronate dehydratase
VQKRNRLGEGDWRGGLGNKIPRKLFETKKAGSNSIMDCLVYAIYEI